ncbi:hypothetical protein [uncultured Paludibaculum sp.]|uniref:hypothetical protein n=1 Tax=uncultured Paludibaculum sp. TaxID=1765020 RepID=UPI002AAB69E2|nr:hypothetical protein [uncultured Paludibaculum sp.]
MEDRLNMPGSGTPEAKPKRKGNPFQPGHPRYGGRKKGSPLKRTKEAREIADKLNFHPVEFLARCAQGEMPNPDGSVTVLDTAQRLDAAKSVAPYIAPKLQATQVTGVDDGPVAFDLPTQAILSDPDMTAKLSELAMLMAEGSGDDSVN